MSVLESVYRFMCCISLAKYPTPYQFTFRCGERDLARDAMFESNYVKTAKYTWYSCFPTLYLSSEALLLQFQRLANIYFLLIAILQTIPIISPLGAISAWVPLCVVLAISILREFYEDYQRYKSDKEMNELSSCLVLREHNWERIKWSEVVVGDICMTQQEEQFPADLILLSSSSQGGVAFIETASLDGEKNLKPRNSLKETASLNSVETLRTFEGRWLGIVPDKELHQFSSKIETSNGIIVFEGDKQLLYRGTRLKNTKWIFGMAIYTGRNTKIMMNSESASIKMSQIEVKVNFILIFILLMQIVLCLALAICYAVWTTTGTTSTYYLVSTSLTLAESAVLRFFTFLVLLNTMIPISIIVSIEIVKMAQSYFINFDKLMYSAFRSKYCSVKSASLNEELGQIEYVFSDKTGTLTMNLMEFKIAVIGSTMFGDLGLIINDPNRPPQKAKGFHDDSLKGLLANGSNNKQLSPPMVIKNKDGGQARTFSNLKEVAEEYFQALSIAHEVVAEPNKAGEVVYQGPSPDEISLVAAAKEMQFQFVNATSSKTTIKVRGVEKTYDLLEVFPFNSDRKRMSVLVRINGVIHLYTKGADSIIKSRLAADQKLNLDSELSRFSRIGLRTLLVGMRYVSEDEYREYRKKVESLPSTNKQVLMEEIVSKMEKEIYLIGATAVLDRLQDEVPETIRDLIRAGIKVWMLTGDKMETAQNIAKSCQLIQHGFHIIRYEPPKVPEQSYIHAPNSTLLGETNDNLNEPPRVDPILSYLKALTAEAEGYSEKGQEKAFLIEGSDLTPILETDERRTELANMAKYCEAVVCCRLLPIQKAQVVETVRTKLNKITLSIGDGANDVPMIKTAHIGVGLFGEEGMSAVQAADYALPEFRMLWRLLLVHGRWNYIRIAEMILYFFYKNMLFTVPQFIFAFWSGFSGQSIFDNFYIALYNLIFTSLPLILRAVLQQDLNYLVVVQPGAPEQEWVMKTSQDAYLPPNTRVNKYLYRMFPKLYFVGQQNLVFNAKNFFSWIFEGIIEATIITVFTFVVLGYSNAVNAGGYGPDVWQASLTVYSSVIVVVTFKLATHTKFWSWILVIGIVFLSLSLYLGFMWITNAFITQNVKGTTFIVWTNAEHYFLVIFITCLVLAVDALILLIDFEKGSYISRLREACLEDEQIDAVKLKAHALSLTQGLTMNNVQS